MAIFDTSYSSNYVDRSDTLMKYFDEIKNFELLSQEEEKDLFIKMKNGDVKARNKIINSNQRFVVSFAKRWGSKENLSDLINEGNIGMIKAMDTFDPERGTRFLTHAVWLIRSAINNYLITNDKIVKPVNNHKVYIAANKIKNNFYAKNGRFPTSEETTEIMSTEYNYRISNKEDVYDIKISSLDDTYGSDSDGDGGLICENSSRYNDVSASCNTDEYIENDFNITILGSLLNTLPPKHLSIIKMLFGIDELRPYEMEEVAEKVGMTRERIRQLKKEILDKLSNNLKEMKVAV